MLLQLSQHLLLQIIKIDTETREKKIFWEEKCHLNEPVFVPAPSPKVLLETIISHINIVIHFLYVVG